MGKLLDPKMKNSIKCLYQAHSDTLLHRLLNQGFATIQLQELVDIEIKSCEKPSKMEWKRPIMNYA